MTASAPASCDAGALFRVWGSASSWVLPHSLQVLGWAQVGERRHLSQRAYAHYEAGTREMPVEILIALADLYGVNLDYPVGRTGSKEPLPPPMHTP